MGKVESMLKLYAAGKTRKQLMEMGYAKGTVLRQCWEYDKLKLSLKNISYGNNKSIRL